MVKSGTNLTKNGDNLSVKAAKSSQSQKEVAKQSSASRLVKNQKIYGYLKNVPRCGRPRKTTNRIKNIRKKSVTD